MKTLLIPMLVLFGALLPIAQVQARGPASKNFGGLKSGTKFTLTVQSVSSAQTVGKKTKLKAPVPEGIPKFKAKQKIKFTIGKNGELKGPGLSIAYVGSSGSVNAYAKLPNYKTISPNNATVVKDSKGKPIGGTMTFYLYRISARDFTTNGLSINRVVYTLK